MCWDGSLVSGAQACPPETVACLDGSGVDDAETCAPGGGRDERAENTDIRAYQPEVRTVERTQYVVDFVTDAGDRRGSGRNAPACARGDGGQLACQAQDLLNCQLDMLTDETLALTCHAGQAELLQTQVSVGENAVATARRIVIELADDSGRPWPRLCAWNIPLPATDETGAGFVRSCAPSDDRLSTLFAAQTQTRALPDDGRIGYHSPSEMVANQPYLLELAIAPKYGDESNAIAETRITEIIGPGTLEPEAKPLDLRFSSTDISELMAVDLIGPGLEIFPITDEEQLLVPDEATVWQWQVTATQPGAKLLNFSVAQVIEKDGRTRRRSVKRLPVMVNVVTIDTLLAESGSTAPVAAANPAPAASFARSVARRAPDAPQCQDSDTGSEIRRALLVTNASYTSPVSTLSETHNDGLRLLDSLNAAGFKVRHCRDLSRDQTIS
ncbi:MAG: hypothetical protein VXW22_15210, partial [Pseudomonadota bacterium]|nr:hypothetical protein [Pseudomonadota bacterium]